MGRHLLLQTISYHSYHLSCLQCLKPSVLSSPKTHSSTPRFWGAFSSVPSLRPHIIFRLGFGVWGLGFGVFNLRCCFFPGFGFWVSGFGFRLDGGSGDGVHDRHLRRLFRRRESVRMTSPSPSRPLRGRNDDVIGVAVGGGMSAGTSRSGRSVALLRCAWRRRWWSTWTTSSCR